MHFIISVMLLSTAHTQEQYTKIELKPNYDDIHNIVDDNELEFEFLEKDEETIDFNLGLEYSFDTVNLAIQSLEDEAKRIERSRLWNEYKMTHSKNYKTYEEEMKRILIFEANVKDIEAHNKRYHKGLETFKMGINQFTDMTNEEYKNTYFHQMLPLNMTTDHAVKESILNEKIVEHPYMWYTNKLNVKDQEACKSGWAFAATATLEYEYFMYRQKIYSLSEQEFLDCDNQSSGCNGGYPYYAFLWAYHNITNFEKEYPYEQAKHTCRRRKNGPRDIIKNIGITPRSEKSFVDQLKYGPFTVSVCAQTIAWQHYHCGFLTYSDCDCKPNHSVLMVGAVNTLEGPMYWLRNSVGANWGYAGHIKLLMNQNTCHIAEEGGQFIQHIP